MNPQPDTSGTATTTGTNLTAEEATASQLVVTFGSHLKNVSLLAPNASTTIASEYGNYIDPALLVTWQANPSIAPGRETSSPSPDHIEISSVQPSAGGYMVQGNIMMVTSSGSAGSIPFSAMVQLEGGQWYITSFVQSATTAS